MFKKCKTVYIAIYLSIYIYPGSLGGTIHFIKCLWPGYCRLFILILKSSSSRSSSSSSSSISWGYHSSLHNTIRSYVWTLDSQSLPEPGEGNFKGLVQQQCGSGGTSGDGGGRNPATVYSFLVIVCSLQFWRQTRRDITVRDSLCL